MKRPDETDCHSRYSGLLPPPGPGSQFIEEMERPKPQNRYV